MRARLPDVTGSVDRDGVALGYEVYGDGDRTVLLMPTWTIVNTRFWKLQVPYLARHFRVITYDGPGNGASDRATDPARYAADAYAADAAAVLAACGVDRAAVVGLSLGAQYSVRLATHHPDLVAALVLVGPALPLAPPPPERASIAEGLRAPLPADPVGWQRYNIAYWRHDLRDFAEFFFSQAISEAHSTKPREDAVSWAMETTADVLEADAGRPLLGIGVDEIFAGVRCPTLVIHGTDDRIHPHQTGVEAARLSGGTLVSFAGGGHMPNVRDPIRFNLVLRDFLERVA